MSKVMEGECAEVLWEKILGVRTWQEAKSLYERHEEEFTPEMRKSLFGVWEKLISEALSKTTNAGTVRRLRKNAPPNSRVRRSTEFVLEALETKKRCPHRRR